MMFSTFLAGVATLSMFCLKQIVQQTNRVCFLVRCSVGRSQLRSHELSIDMWWINNCAREICLWFWIVVRNFLRYLWRTIICAQDIFLWFWIWRWKNLNCEFWKGFIKLFEWMKLFCKKCDLCDNLFWARHFLFSIFELSYTIDYHRENLKFLCLFLKNGFL